VVNVADEALSARQRPGRDFFAGGRTLTRLAPDNGDRASVIGDVPR